VRGDPCIDCNRLAKGLYRRASELLREPLPQPSAVLADAPAPLPAHRRPSLAGDAPRRRTQARAAVPRGAGRAPRGS